MESRIIPVARQLTRLLGAASSSSSSSRGVHFTPQVAADNSSFDVVQFNLMFVKEIPPSDRLKLAALYQQATKGPNNTEPPHPKKKKHAWAKEKAADFEERLAYWKAWKDLGTLSKEEAAKKYVDFGTKFLKESGISSDVGVV